MRSAKEVFLTSGHAVAFAKAVSDPSFDPACQLAISQLAAELRPTAVPGAPVDPYVAIDSNSQLWGARRVLEILAALADPIKEPTKHKEPTIYHS